MAVELSAAVENRMKNQVSGNPFPLLHFFGQQTPEKHQG
jgi:hypothetical protein